MLDKFHGEVDRPGVMHRPYCLKLGEPILHENKFAKKRAEEKRRRGLRALKAAESSRSAQLRLPAAARRRSRTFPRRRLRRRGYPVRGIPPERPAAAAAWGARLGARRESGGDAPPRGGAPSSPGGRDPPRRRRARGFASCWASRPGKKGLVHTPRGSTAGRKRPGRMRYPEDGVPGPARY